MDSPVNCHVKFAPKKTRVPAPLLELKTAIYVHLSRHNSSLYLKDSQTAPPMYT